MITAKDQKSNLRSTTKTSTQAKTRALPSTKNCRGSKLIGRTSRQQISIKRMTENQDTMPHGPGGDQRTPQPQRRAQRAHQ